ncbi:MAG: MBL fold metallo-hydrolase [Simkaniaceae bacterium]|nr:MBL fold metallo-hydrolase [Candidatus Sacchlamyda saccharinae]
MDESPLTNRNGRYLNPHIENIRRKPKDFLMWSLGFFRDVPFSKVPEGFSYPMPDREFDPKQPWAMWIGHSTYLISVAGKTILTDPIWSNRCSPVPFFGPKRKHPAPVPLDQLPQIDYVLISHDHYDHLDRVTVEALNRKFPDILWVVPRGVKKWFEKMRIKRVVELSWWDEQDVDSTFKVTAVPAQHFSGRKTKDLNKTLWAGYVLEDLLTSKTLYFVGDTGYNEHHFKKIGEKFENIDLSLIPIGAYSPRTFMAPVHVEPRDAVRIHSEVRSTLSLGMHWKTFRLSEEPLNQPPFDLFCSMKEEGLDPHTFLAPEPGHKINW